MQSQDWVALLWQSGCRDATAEGIKGQLDYPHKDQGAEGKADMFES